MGVAGTYRDWGPHAPATRRGVALSAAWAVRRRPRNGHNPFGQRTCRSPAICSPSPPTPHLRGDMSMRTPIRHGEVMLVPVNSAPAGTPKGHQLHRRPQRVRSSSRSGQRARVHKDRGCQRDRVRRPRRAHPAVAPEGPRPASRTSGTGGRVASRARRRNSTCRRRSIRIRAAGPWSIDCIRRSRGPSRGRRVPSSARCRRHRRHRRPHLYRALAIAVLKGPDVRWRTSRSGPPTTTRAKPHSATSSGPSSPTSGRRSSIACSR